MGHVPDGTLRRMVDEPFAVSDADTRHLGHCGRCQGRGRQITKDAHVTQMFMSRPQPVSDEDLAWARLVRRLDEATRPEPVRIPRHRRWRLIGASASTGVTVATVGVVLAGVAAAATLTTIYAPTKVAPVAVDPSDLRALATLAGYDGNSVLGGFPGISGTRQLPFGILRWDSTARGQKVASIGEAEAATGLTVSLPEAVPAGVGAPSGFFVDPAVTATITFGAGAGRALEGSSLRVTLGPAVFVQYGSSAQAVGVPALGIMSMKRPMITSTGATMSQLESFLLSRPGVPSDLAQEIRLLGDLRNTLPVPALPGITESSTTIGGSQAVVLTVPSGVASGVIWEDDEGEVHTVAGLLDRQDVLSVARQIG